MTYQNLTSMSSAVTRRGQHMIRQLSFHMPLRVTARSFLISDHIRHPLHATNVSLPVTTTGLSKNILPWTLNNSYATAARPKAHTGNAPAKKRAVSSEKAKKTLTKTVNKTPRQKAKKELTPGQKEAQKTREQLKEIRQLKEAALKRPKRLPASVWQAVFPGVLKETRGTGGGVEASREAFREASRKVKAMSPEELEPYSRQVESNKAANASAYEAWVKSHTPLQIRQANLARRRLAKLTKERTNPVRLPVIRDDRQVKLPPTSFRLYLSERFESGDFKQIPVSDATARAAQEWKGFTEGEKEKYMKLSKANREQYVQAYRSVYGEDPQVVKRRKSPSA